MRFAVAILKVANNYVPWLKLKLCESIKLPKWLVDFHAKSRGTSNLPQSSKTNRNDYCVGYSLKPKLKGKTDQASVPDGPYRGTRSKTNAAPSLERSHKRPTSEGKTKRKHCCLCKQVNTEGMMVQCDECRDWFHPGCVGITAEDTESLPVYKCPGCCLVPRDTTAHVWCGILLTT